MSSFLGGILTTLAAFAITGSMVFMYYGRKPRDSSKVRMLARQYRAMTESAGRDIAMDEIGRPELISSRMEFRKIEAIEIELVSDSDRAIAINLLNSFFASDDPWVRARAAKAMHRMDPKGSYQEIHKLLVDESPYVQMAGIWSLGELATPHCIEQLTPLVWNKNPEVQQTAIRCLVQMESRQQIPVETLQRVKTLLKEVRYKTDWIL